MNEILYQDYNKSKASSTKNISKNRNYKYSIKYNINNKAPNFKSSINSSNTIEIIKDKSNINSKSLSSSIIKVNIFI